jgi:hypothetical protein
MSSILLRSSTSLTTARNGRIRSWRKANPGLGTIKNEKTLADKVTKAISNPALVKNLVCKEFNIRETSTEAWLTFEQLNNTDKFSFDFDKKVLIWEHYNNETKTLETKEFPLPRYGIGGADLSSTTDLTAAKVIFMVPGCLSFLSCKCTGCLKSLLSCASARIKSRMIYGPSRGLCASARGIRFTPNT